MLIDRVTVRVGELRSTGYPTFSNSRVEVELSAQVEPGETAAAVKNRLIGYAREAVERELGIEKPDSEMGRPMPTFSAQPSLDF